MKRTKKEADIEAKEEEIKEEVATLPAQSLELARLVTLWEDLKALGVNSISDLEVKIARLQ